jgi:hypothetical protein
MTRSSLARAVPPPIPLSAIEMLQRAGVTVERSIVAARNATLGEVFTFTLPRLTPLIATFLPKTIVDTLAGIFRRPEVVTRDAPFDAAVATRTSDADLTQGLLESGDARRIVRMIVAAGGSISVRLDRVDVRFYVAGSRHAEELASRFVCHVLLFRD